MRLCKRLFAGIGTGLLLGLVAALAVLPLRNPLYVDAALSIRFEYWMLLAVLLPASLVARSARGAAVASGLLFGFTGLLRLGYWEGPIWCGNNSLPACVGRTPNDWAGVTALLLAAAIVLLVVAWRRTPSQDRPALPHWSRRRWATLTAIWVAAIGMGIAAALATAIVIGPSIDDARYFGGAFGWLYVALFTLWASVAAFTTLARSPGTRFIASGLLIGFAGLLRVGTLNGSVGCTIDFPSYCIPGAGALWATTTDLALVIGVLLPVLAIRKEASRSDLSLSALPPSSSRPTRGHRLAGLSSGPALISELERKLGMSVVVHSVDESAPVRIHALLRYGPQSREVTAIGPSEPDAWRELARMATAWRNANENLVPLWGGGL
jgi:hypothetical protein